jgi:gluconokinase
MIVVVMGVAGSGKTTVGSQLAERLGCAFLDADSLHSPANIAKMSVGNALTDEDRDPWLRAVHARMLDAFDNGESLVVACSALTRAYRLRLSDGVIVSWVYLKGEPEVIQKRLEHRTGHFATDALLETQIATLEAPDNAIEVDVARPPGELVGEILERLHHRR